MLKKIGVLCISIVLLISSGVYASSEKSPEWWDEQEDMLAEYVIDHISDYILDTEWCFLPPKCNKKNNEYMSEIGKILEKYGWDNHSYILTILSSNSRIVIHITFMGFVYEDKEFNSIWVLDQTGLRM